MNPLKQVMVKQQVNLYLPRFKPAQLSAAMKLLIKSMLAVFAILLVASILLASTRLILQSQLDQAQQGQQILNDELSAVLSKIPNMTIDKALQERIEREKQLLGKQNRVISFLRQDSINDSTSFTPLVEQLSQQAVKGVWLSKFEIINQGKDIQLFGFAQSPDKVSKYLTMLGNQEAYQGRVFKQIQVKRGERAWSEFFLSTQEKENEISLLSAEQISGARL
ncbi:MAG: PilN domain-containing protein [Oleispira sp.]